MIKLYLIIGIIIGALLSGVMFVKLCSNKDSLYYSSDPFIYELEDYIEKLGLLVTILTIAFCFLAFMILWPIIFAIILLALIIGNNAKESV